jgi:acyl carrier protein
MNGEEILNEIKQIISTELDVELDKVNLQSNSSSIPQWDSISNINIIDSIESKFNIEFTIDEIYNAENVADWVNFIKLKFK